MAIDTTETRVPIQPLKEGEIMPEGVSLWSGEGERQDWQRLIVRRDKHITTVFIYKGVPETADQYELP